MVNLPIGDIISGSFKLAWRHKYLWLFGLFAAGSNGFGGMRFGGDEPTDFEALGEWVLAALAAIILIGLLVAIVYLILHTISKSALIYNVYQIETKGVHGLGAGWDFGLKRFWPMLGVTLLEIVVIMAFMFALVLLEIVFFVVSPILGFVSLPFAIPGLFAGLAAIIVTFVYAERFVALETQGVIGAIGEGVSLLAKQWKPSLLMALVKVAIGIGVAIVLVVIGIVLVLPAIALWVISKPLAILFGVAVLLPYGVLTTCYFGVFDSAAWTKAFLHLRAPAYAPAAASEASPSEPDRDSEPPRASPPLFE